MTSAARSRSCLRAEPLDCKAGTTLLDRLPDCDIVHGDKGYDANALRATVQERGALANIPPKANRKWLKAFMRTTKRDYASVNHCPTRTVSLPFGSKTTTPFTARRAALLFNARVHLREIKQEAESAL